MSPAANRSRCFYFGTFNPVHLGHLMIAEAALDQFSSPLGFEQVHFVPAARPPLKKPDPDLAAFDQRLRMLALAIGDHPSFTVDPLEGELEGPSYTVRTFRECRERYNLGPDRIPFIIGSDALADLHAWRDPETLIREALFLQAPRPGAPFVGSLRLSGREVPLATERIDMPETTLSASRVRDRLRAGKSIRYLVPEPVRRFLLEQGLYQSIRQTVVPPPAGSR